MNKEKATKVWGQCLELLSTSKETNSPLAKTYLDYLVPVSLDERQIVFKVRLLHSKEQIETRYLSFIKEAVTAVTESALEVVIVNDETVDEASITSPMPVFTQQESSVSAEPLLATPSTSAPSPLLATPSSNQEGATMGTGLSSLFSPDENPQPSFKVESGSRSNFSNYIVGENNKFAYTMSVSVAEAPGTYVNPLFIYGRSGLGKTHLLLSIENYINTYLPDKKVVYTPTTEFVNDFTNSLTENNNLQKFKLKYQTCDVLLIDDVQNLEGKVETTNALFEIFNIFITQNKQIVLSADRSPSEIKLDERFTSRFAHGISADIQPPNYETKTAILKHYKQYYCSFRNIPEVEFSDEAIQRIVDLSGSNIREIEGAVGNLVMFNECRPESQKRSSITSEDVDNVLGNSFFHKTTRRIDITMVMQAVESYFNVSHAELLSDKRSKNISHPRQVAMYLIRRHTDMSYPEIGDSFNKDHTTVMYADRNIQEKMAEDISIKAEVERITEILTS